MSRPRGAPLFAGLEDGVDAWDNIPSVLRAGLRAVLSEIDEERRRRVEAEAELRDGAAKLRVELDAVRKYAVDADQRSRRLAAELKACQDKAAASQKCVPVADAIQPCARCCCACFRPSSRSIVTSPVCLPSLSRLPCPAKRTPIVRVRAQRAGRQGGLFQG